MGHVKPVEFKEQTTEMIKPKNMTDKECNSLPAHIDIMQHLTISCWEPTEEEIQELIKTKKMYLMVWQIPTSPVALQVKNPFTLATLPEPPPPSEAIDSDEE